MRRNDRPRAKWDKFLDKCRVPMVNQNTEGVMEIFPTINSHFSDTSFMHNAVLDNFYGKMLIHFYSGAVERVGKTGRTYGSSSRWNTLGSHKMLFMVGLAMSPMFVDAKVLPNSDATRGSMQGVSCTELERVKGSAVLQHDVDRDLPMYHEMRDQEMNVRPSPCPQSGAESVASYPLSVTGKMAAESLRYWAMEPVEIKLSNPAASYPRMPVGSEDHHVSRNMTTQTTVEGIVTPAWAMNKGEIGQSPILAGGGEECEDLVYAIEQLIRLGRQRLGPGGARQRHPQQAARVDEEVVRPLNPLPHPVVRDPVVAVTQPMVPKVLQGKFSMGQSGR